jgi:predicted nucleotidyltransferase
MEVFLTLNGLPTLAAMRTGACYPAPMRLTPLETQVLELFEQRLCARLGPRLGRLILFGSRARGEGHEESDLDVLVLVSDLAPGEKQAILDVSFDLELEHGLALSPLVRDAQAFRADTPLGRAIERDGVTL